MIFERRHYILSMALSICVLLETLALTYMQEKRATFYYSSSVLYFISGLAICIIPIISINRNGKSIRANEFISKSIPYLGGLFFMMLVVYHIVWLKSIYHNVAIDKQWADMLPSIQLACQRFLQGKIIYGPAQEISANSIIPYLPLMWMPFLPAVILDFDLRWITFAAQFIGISIALKPVFGQKKLVPFVPVVIAGIGLFLLLNYLIIKNSGELCLNTSKCQEQGPVMR